MILTALLLASTIFFVFLFGVSLDVFKDNTVDEAEETKEEIVENDSPENTNSENTTL